MPITFIDSYKPFDQKGSKRVTVQIHYLNPIYYEEYKDLNTVELANMVHFRIKAMLNQENNIDKSKREL